MQANPGGQHVEAAKDLGQGGEDFISVNIDS